MFRSQFFAATQAAAAAAVNRRRGRGSAEGVLERESRRSAPPYFRPPRARSQEHSRGTIAYGQVWIPPGRRPVSVLPSRARRRSPLRYRDGVTSIPTSTARSCISIHRVAIVLNMAHTEELLDRRAVEVRGCHGTQGAEDFVKSMKPGVLGGHGGSSSSTTR